MAPKAICHTHPCAYYICICIYICKCMCIRNMDPKAMASMSKMMGREGSEGEMEKMQSMMRRS